MSWTHLRIEIEKCIKELDLGIISINIMEWEQIQCNVVEHFTGAKSGFTWMWEEKILFNTFDHYANYPVDLKTRQIILSESINYDELLWLFIADSHKYWGYEGKIKDILKLLSKIQSPDFYIASKKLKWVIGRNHHHALFGFGEIDEFKHQMKEYNK